jgi:hypothetical protein
MRKSRFTDEQIVGILQEYGSSVKRLIQLINRSAVRNEGLGVYRGTVLRQCAALVMLPF